MTPYNYHANLYLFIYILVSLFGIRKKDKTKRYMKLKWARTHFARCIFSKRVSHM